MFVLYEPPVMGRWDMARKKQLKSYSEFDEDLAIREAEQYYLLNREEIFDVILVDNYGEVVFSARELVEQVYR
jgi:hypothetical protein